MTKLLTSGCRASRKTSLLKLPDDLPGPLPTGQVSGVLDRTFLAPFFLVDSARMF